MRIAAAPALLVPWLAVVFGASTACSPGTVENRVDSPPVQGAYAIQFPSTEAAIATTVLQIFVFDANANRCASVIQARKSNQDLPPQLLPVTTTSPCAIENLDAGALAMPLGNVAILVVGQGQDGKDLLIGCAAESLTSAIADAGEPAVTIQLTLASASIKVPSTPCLALSERCSGKTC